MKSGEVNLHSFVGGPKTMLQGIDATSVHGSIPEMLFAAFQMTFAVITPALMIGAFAERMKFPASTFGGVKGPDYGIVSGLWIQLKAACLTRIYVIVATFVVLKLVQLSIGIRVDNDQETRGLDLSEHEERGYIL